MENKNIIIILVVIIVILAAVIGFLVLKPMYAKEPTKLKITSNDTLYESKDLTFKLADLNKTPLSNQKVNITIKNSKGKVVANKTVETNDNGNAKMDLNLKKGKYNVTATYAGNENYIGNNTTQKLTIKEKVAEVESSVSSSNSNGGNNLEGPETDSLGITKEQAMHAEQVSGRDVKYDSKSGMYLHYDPNTGTYHN